MRAALPLGLVALLVLAAPTAAACLYAPPPLLDGLVWRGDGTLLGGAALFQQGVVDLADGTVAPAFPSPALWSPDGRHLVFARAGPDVQTGPTRMMDDCGLYLSRHLLAYDRVDDRFMLVDEGPVWGFGPAPEGVVAYDGRVARVRGWGAWDVVAQEPAAGVVEPLRWSGVVQPDAPGLAPDGARFAEVVDARELRLVRTSDGEELARRALDAPAGGLAWRPDGALLALALPHNGTHARVLLLDGATLETQKEIEVKRVESDALQRFHERAAQEVPVPEYSWLEKTRATPGAPLALALAFALSLRARGTSRGPRP